MPEEKFKLPRSSYEELVKIIKAYAQYKEAVSLDEVSKLIGLHRTVISSNVRFLTEIEILEAGAKKVATSKGKDLAHALEHEMPDEIRYWWRKVVTECEFLSKLLTAIKIRNGMDETTLQSHIAYSAGQPKRSEVMTGARTVIDILRAAELIKEMDGKFNIIPGQETLPDEDVISKPPYSENQQIAATVPGPISLPADRTPSGNVSFTININLSIDCAQEDLEGLGKKLRSMVKKLSEKESEIGDELNQENE